MHIESHTIIIIIIIIIIFCMYSSNIDFCFKIFENDWWYWRDAAWGRECNE